MYLNEIYCSGDIICEGGLKVRRLITTSGEIPSIDEHQTKNRLVKFKGAGVLTDSELSIDASEGYPVITLHEADSLIFNFLKESSTTEALKISKNNNDLDVTLLSYKVKAKSTGNLVFLSSNDKVEAESTKDIKLSNGTWVFV